MKTVKEYAYAKINLWLDIIGKRPDGYHDIKTVMQTVSLCDAVTVGEADNGITMTCTDETLSCGADNLCIKAAEAFCAETGTERKFHIALDKKIPREAGLGGGSADAAAVLRALNTLCGTGLGADELAQIGKKLGADVPFCIRGGCLLAEGIGEKLSDFPPLPVCQIVISGGIGHISTPVAYRLIDETAPSQRGDFSSFADAAKKGDLSGIGKTLYNRFEDCVPESGKVKAVFNENGTIASLMTGSGSAVFGLFTDEKTAHRACLALENAGLTAYMCRSVGGIGF